MPNSSVYALTRAALQSLIRTVSGELIAQIPAGRFGDAAEVAKAVVLFASDEATYIVGSELTIDGGMSTL